MSQPPYPHADGLPQQPAQDGAGGWQPPAAPYDPGPPAVVWGPPPGPSWSPPGALSWEPPFGPPLAGPVPVPPRHAGNPVLLVLVALAALLVGGVGAGVLVTVMHAAQAEEIGRAVGEEVSRSMEDAVGGFMGGEWGAGGPMGSGPVEEFPAVAPGPLGPDPVLDGYAADCFTGDLQACDDLFYESPPMSEYEEYAATCGGRVKLYAVLYCTELE